MRERGGDHRACLSRYRSATKIVKINVGDKDFHLEKEQVRLATALETKLRHMTMQTSEDEDLAPVSRKPRDRKIARHAREKLQDGTVDCDPISFQYILNFFTREGSFVPQNQTELRNLKEAVDRYRIDEMKMLLHKKTLVANTKYLMLQV